jgi:type IV fimbrial biogenesis protein FimT
MPRPQSPDRGHTLVELAAALAVVAVTAAWAVPRLSAWHQEAELRAAVNRCAQAVFLARSEAIKRNATVSVCPSADGQRCLTSGDWAQGWIVFVNVDRDSPAVRDDGEPLLRADDGLANGSVASNRTTLSLRAFAQPAAAATITFCDDRGSDFGRAVIISQTGRPRIDRRNAGGGALRC